MNLQEVVTRTSLGQFDEVEADRASAARGDRKRVQQTSWRAVLSLDTLACRTRAYERVQVRRQGRPPNRTTGEGQCLIAAEVSAEWGSVELLKDLLAQHRVRGDAQAVAARAAPVQEPAAPDEGAGELRPWGRRDAGGVDDATGGGTGRQREGAEDWVGRQCAADRRSEVRMEEKRSTRRRPGLHEERGDGGAGRWGPCLGGETGCSSTRHRKELQRGCRVGVFRARTRGRVLAAGESLSSEEVGGVRATRDVHHAELVLCEEVQPARLVVTQRALLHEPCEAGVVRMQLEGPVKQVGAQGLQRLHHGEQLQQMGGVCALGGREFAGLEGNRVECTGVVRLLEDR